MLSLPVIVAVFQLHDGFIEVEQKRKKQKQQPQSQINNRNILDEIQIMYKQRRPTMNDLDVQLIREFALRPIIYNKATPFFKNKYLTDCAWDEIAAKVGGDGESFSTDFIS